MKIALLTEGFFTEPYAEAANITIRILSNFLVKKGHKVYIITKKYPGQMIKEYHAGIKIRRTSENKGVAVSGFSKEIQKVIDEDGKEFDIIHNFSSSPLLTLRGIAAKKYSKKAKLIHTIKANTAYKITYLLSVLLNFNDVVTVSADFLKKKLTLFGCIPSKIKIIPSYIDADKFKPQDKDNLRKKYGYENIKTVVYYGHMSERKGISKLIKATNILKNKGKKNILTLFVTGSGDSYIKPYAEKIAKLGLEKEIKIIKTTKNVEDYVNLANVIVLPYPNLISTEAQPSCVLETMAAKTPLIVSDLKELRELVSSSEVNFVTPSNEHELAKKIEQVLEKKVNTKLLEKSRKKALRFDYKKIIPRYIKIYEDLIE